MSAAATSGRSKARQAGLVILALVVLALIVLGALYWMGTHDDDMTPATTSQFDDPQLIERGAYLARIGNCVTCHTVPDGQAYAGGRAVPTPFGTLYGPNITFDETHGIGAWSADDFWRALHNGKDADGRLLYPAFPYPEYSRVTRADADAIYAFLRSQPPSDRPDQPNTLRFPYNQQVALAVWRALNFRPQAFVAIEDQDTVWNRGAYLVEGLGHCAACHTPRNRLGATVESAALAGATIPVLDWYAPPLTGNQPHGMDSWSEAQIASLLQAGISEKGTASGPMAEVVFQSLQYLTDDDAAAMARYIKSLPASDAARLPEQTVAGNALMTRGSQLYETHCLDCHGAQGAGKGEAYPPLAGNITVTAPAASNAIRVVMNGGYAPGTARNPQPYGMPPFRQILSDTDIAAVVTYIRGSWGNQAGPVAANVVHRYRTIR